MCEECEECVEVLEREVVLCFWESWGCAWLCPFVGGRLATELSMVVGSDRLETRGVVSSTSSSVRGWRPWAWGPCVV